MGHPSIPPSVTPFTPPSVGLCGQGAGRFLNQAVKQDVNDEAISTLQKKLILASDLYLSVP